MVLEYYVAEFLIETILKKKQKTCCMTLNEIQDLRNEADPQIIPFLNEIEKNLQCLCNKIPEIFELRNSVLYLSEAFQSVYPFSAPYSEQYSEQKACLLRERNKSTECENHAIDFFKKILQSGSPLHFEKLFQMLIKEKNYLLTSIFSKYSSTEMHDFFKHRPDDFIVSGNYVYLKKKVINLDNSIEKKLHYATLYLLTCFKFLHYFQLKQCISYVLEDVKYYLNQFSILKQREIFTNIPLTAINDSGFMELGDAWFCKPLDFRVQAISGISKEEKIILLIVCILALSRKVSALSVLREIEEHAPEAIKIGFCNESVSTQLQFIKNNSKYFKFTKVYVSLHPYFVFPSFKYSKQVEKNIPSENGIHSLQVECDTLKSISVSSNILSNSVAESSSNTVKNIQKSLENYSGSYHTIIVRKNHCNNMENFKNLTSGCDKPLEEQKYETVCGDKTYSSSQGNFELNSVVSETDVVLKSKASVSPQFLVNTSKAFKGYNQDNSDALVNIDKQKLEALHPNHGTVSGSVRISSELMLLKLRSTISCILKYLTDPIKPLILKAVFHIFEDCSSYFCDLSETDKIKLIKDFYSEGIFDRNRISSQDYQALNFELSAEEVNLLIVAYILAKEKRMHFLKLFKRLQAYCEIIPDCTSTEQQQFNYFKERNKFFVIENCGYVTLCNFPQSKNLNFENIFSKCDKAFAESEKTHTLSGLSSDVRAEKFEDNLTSKEKNVTNEALDSFSLSPEKGCPVYEYYNIETSNPFLGQAYEKVARESKCVIQDRSTKSISLSNEFVCARMQKSLEYLRKYFEITLDSLLLEAILHVLDDCRTHVCSLHETHQIDVIKEAFSLNDELKKDCYSFTVQNIKLKKEEKNLLFITYFLVHKGNEHFVRIFKQFKERSISLPSTALNVREQFSYFKDRQKYFIIGGDGYVTLHSPPELIKFINKFPSSVFTNNMAVHMSSLQKSSKAPDNQIKSEINKNEQLKPSASERNCMPISANCAETLKNILPLRTEKLFANHRERNNYDCFLDTKVSEPQVILNVNKVKNEKISSEPACDKVQNCIAYLHKYFRFNLDTPLFHILRAVFHVLEDCRSHFCSLSESSRICFIKKCFRPFPFANEEILEYNFENLQDFKLTKEEKDLIFIAYLLVSEGKLHFLKIFKTFEEYGTSVSQFDLSVSERFNYFRKRKTFFCIENDGFVTLNPILKLDILNSVNSSHSFNVRKASPLSKDSLFRENQNQPANHLVTNHVVTQNMCDENLKFNHISKTAKTTDYDDSSDYSEVNLTQNIKVSENICDKNYIFDVVLSCNIFISEVLHETDFNLGRLKIIFHIFDDERTHFSKMPNADQINFVKEIFDYFSSKKTSLRFLNNDFKSIRPFKLSNRKRLLLCISHFLYPNEKIHYLALFKKVNDCYKLPEYLSAENVQFIFFKKEKKYFNVKRNGFVELNFTYDSKIINSEIFSGHSSPDSGICSSPVSCDQGEKNCFSMNDPFSVTDTVIDLCTKILVNSKRIHFEKIFKMLINIGSDEIQNFITSLSISEKFKFFKNASCKFKMGCDGYVTLKTCTKPSSTYIKDQSVNRDETIEEIAIFPSNSLLCVSNSFTKYEKNIKSSGEVTRSRILHESAEPSISSKISFNQEKEINMMHHINIDTSKNSVIVKEQKKKMSSNDELKKNYYSEDILQNVHSLEDKHIEEEKQEEQKKKMSTNDELMQNSYADGIPQNMQSLRVKHVEETKQEERKKKMSSNDELMQNLYSEDILQNAQSLEDKSVDSTVLDRYVNDSFCLNNEMETDSFLIRNKVSLCNSVTKEPIPFVINNVSKPIEMLYSGSGKCSDLKQNITSDLVSYSLKNSKSQSEFIQSFKSDKFNGVNAICPKDISPVLKGDVFNELYYKSFNSSVLENEISNLQRLPGKSPKFIKYPSSESEVSVFRACKEMSTAPFLDQCSNYSEDRDSMFIKSQLLSYNNISYSDYCSEIVDSFLGPLNLKMDHILTSDTLKDDELVSHDVSFCLKEGLKLEEHANIHKNTERELQIVNFFIIVLSKYSIGLPIHLLYTHLKIASKEIKEYLNHYYQGNLLHFFLVNTKYFYVSPVSRNIYLRQQALL